MTQFIQHNFIELDPDEDTIKIVREQNLCLCCLSKTAEVVSLASCKHSSFFEFFFKFKFQYQNSVICFECHHQLKKFEQFRQQVKKSIGILWSEQGQPYQLPKKLHNLVCTEIQYCSSEDIPILEENTVEDTAATPEPPCILTTEVKIEFENWDNEAETSMPSFEITKKNDDKNSYPPIENKSTQNKLPLESQSGTYELDDNYYHSKIVLKILDRNEMMMERENEAKKDSYIKFRYKCESCVVGFDYEQVFNDHMTKRHTLIKGGFVCEICTSVLSSKASYTEHMKKHFRRYECVECGKRTTDIYAMEDHCKKFHGFLKTSYKCSECDFTTDSHRRFRYHRDKQHKALSSCAQCEKTFVTAGSLKTHMFTVHGTHGRNFGCDTCGKAYRSKSGLLSHQRTHVKLTTPEYCATCKKYFVTPNGLLHHLKNHSAHATEDELKRFICDECGLKFRSKISLQEHIDFVHLKKNEHKCTKCAKVFVNARFLRKHVDYVHNKRRPPKNKICDHCGLGFHTLSILRSHIRTHTGERPLQCPECTATFAHSGALYMHKKLVHSGAKAQK